MQEQRVALLAEGVDRNFLLQACSVRRFVALLAEGVDRNAHRIRRWDSITVALLAEGVDRNSLPQLTAYSALHPGIANLSPIGLIVRGAKQKQQAA